MHASGAVCICGLGSCKPPADGLHEPLGLRCEDVFINLVEVKKENWSLGNGEAQYA
jgi:4-oxalocrotonate tautomerase